MNEAGGVFQRCARRAFQLAAWRVRHLLPLAARIRPVGRSSGRAAVILAGGLGDKLMALPAVRHFREERRPLPLTLILLGIAPPFLENEADRIVRLAADDTRGLLREARQGFDACFVNSVGVFEVRLEFAAFLTGARDTRGPRFSTTPPSRTVYARSYVFGEGHETAVNLRGAGGHPESAGVPYPLPLPAHRKPPLADVIFHPGSSSAGTTNRWPVEHYAETARAFQARGLTVLAVGAPNESDLLARLQDLAGTALSTRADLSLPDLAEALAAARLVIANDSGIGHLAAAAGANLLTIMGANRPEKVAPIGPRITVIGPRCPFGGCYNNPDIPECRMCIATISPAEIIAAADHHLTPA